MLRKFFFIALVFSLSRSLAQAPTATITVPSISLCTGMTTVFNSLTTNAPTVFSWTVLPSYGVSLSATDQPSVAAIFTKPGAFTMSLTVSNGSGTMSTIKTVSVTQTPSASFSASLTTSGFPNQIILTNFSSSATTYTWSYSDTSGTDTTFNTAHSYTASGSYSLMLVVSNGTTGCTDTSTYSFYISDSSGITLPNVFTPNSDDVNDVFKPVARGITNIKVDIYTRYGNHVYGWDTPGGSWDGRTPSGEPCNTGTYFCVLEATGFDGKNYKLKTTITLTR